MNTVRVITTIAWLTIVGTVTAAIWDGIVLGGEHQNQWCVAILAALGWAVVMEAITHLMKQKTTRQETRP